MNLNMKIEPVRDITGGIVGAAIGGIGLVGVAAKKLFINDDDGFTKTFLVGLAATVVTGGAALIPYLITAPGGEAQGRLSS